MAPNSDSRTSDDARSQTSPRTAEGAKDGRSAPPSGASDRRRADREDAAEQSDWTWIVPLALLAALIGLYFVWPGYQQFVDRGWSLLASGDRQAIERWVDGFGAWGPLIVLALMILQTLIAFLPSVALMVVSVLAYGPVWGGVLSWGGLLLSATVAYAIGRALGPVTVDRLIGHDAEQTVERYVERYGVIAIIVARISPALSTDAVSYVGGLVQMGYLRFIAATAVGILPLAVLISFLGESIDRLQRGLIWVSVVSLALFALWVWWDRTHGPGAEESGERD